jgi:hypothetical protein
MCFSAAASFTAGASLSLLGAASIGKADSPHQYTFATLPLVFGLQQISEGIVWISLQNEGWSHLTASASLTFLLIAQVVWPILMPYSFMQMEEDVRRKWILQWFLLPGILVASYFVYCLISYDVKTEAINHHVFYALDFPKVLTPYAAGFYLVATVIPPLLSRNIKIQLIGVVFLVAYIVSRLFFQPNLISVWCFFAIAVSLFIYLVLRGDSQKHFVTDALTTKS